MKRASVIVLVVLLALMAIGPIGPASAAGPQRFAPKVAIIVGPVGSKTDSYRKLGNEAGPRSSSTSATATAGRAGTAMS
jgi:hypothetical protein